MRCLSYDAHVSVGAHAPGTKRENYDNHSDLADENLKLKTKLLNLLQNTHFKFLVYFINATVLVFVYYTFLLLAIHPA